MVTEQREEKQAINKNNKNSEELLIPLQISDIVLLNVKQKRVTIYKINLENS